MSYNQFAYCQNSPIYNSDPSGQFILSTLAICVIAGVVAGGTIGGIAGYAYAESNGLEGADRTAAIAVGIGCGGLAGGLLGAAAAPAITSATGVAGVYVSTSGLSTVATTSSLVVPEYVHNAGSYVSWLRNTFEKTKDVLDLPSVKQLFDLANEYKVQITASMNDLNGHPNSNWPIPHIHVGGARIHIAVAEQAIDWIVKQLGGT